MNYEKGNIINTTNPYIHTTPRKWTESEEAYLLQLKQEGASNKKISTILERSETAISIKLKRLKKRNYTYNNAHSSEKTKINKTFVEYIKPDSILDLYCGEGNEAYTTYNTTTNDINQSLIADYHLDALHCICKLYSENKKFDIIDLDSFGSSYDCFDLAIKMAKKGLCITLGEIGHKRFKRLDFVESRYGITSLNDFTSDNLIKVIQTMGIANKKELIVYCKKDWTNISRVWFEIKQFKQVSQWDGNKSARKNITLFDF